MMKQKKYILLNLFLLMFLAGFSQNNQNPPDINVMHQKKWEFMMRNMQLSQEEIQKVKPIFMEHEKTMWELHRKSRNEFMRGQDKKLSEKEYQKLNDRLMNLQIDECNQMRAYYLELKNVLPAEKLYNYFESERMFKRQLLHRRPDFPPNQRMGKGKNQ